MGTSILAILAQLVIVLSVIPYVISIFRGTVKPNRFSWFIWSIIGFVFWLVTPTTADDVTKNIVIIFMINPTIVFILTLFNGEYKKPDRLETLSLIIGILAISLWYFLKDTSGIFPTFIAICADLCIYT
jgi:hypothetical protein